MSADVECPYCGDGNNLSEGMEYIEGERYSKVCDWCDRDFFYTPECKQIFVATKESES